MQGIRQRASRSVRAREVARAGTGWFCLVLAVTLPLAVGVSPAIAQHGLAATPDASDTILAWGDNNDGELGDGTTTDSSTPVEVSLPAGTTITAIAAGHDHSLAVTSAGTALAWGDNRFGQLGDETTTDSITPVDVSLPVGTTVTAIAAGDDHSFAVTSAGTALAWGDNDRGELGDGTTTRSSTPVPISLPAGTTVTAIAGGIAHGLALTSAGAVLAWGLNSDGQLGDGTTTDSSTPVEVSLPAGTTVTAIAAGSLHSLAVTSAGTVLTWGLNADGQLGDGTTTDSSTPVEVSLPAGTTVTAVGGGRGHSLAVTSAGTALAWGDNVRGQLGDGTTTDSSTPVEVSLPAGTTVTTITAIAAGRFHSLAVTSAGTALGWGDNNDGELGDGTTTDSSTPVEVSLPAGTTVTATTAGASHSMALVAPPPASTPPPPASTPPPPDATTPPPDLPTTGASLPISLAAAALLVLTGATLIRLAHQHRPTRRLR
ncbi:RCC1 domain-containing protein [Salinispora oceanensis]|uniref:RCC1 domain-containing protein n=1 Tax=Salinispora oceanensis TaxID=1050199 RepID=UPI0003AAD334|nr:chromosome condensation regulator RCC1 [Salinispora oceanensis]